MKQLSGMRPTNKALGDDVTLTRFVKLLQRQHSNHKTAPMPADATRTRFLARVLPVAAMPHLLVSGHSNVKIGRDVRKGHLRGYWIYTLSLEERATCPASCHHWRDCFGGSMPFAKRIDHTDPAFLPALATEIGQLLSVRGRRGILIRLHALGDFYSIDYVQFWREMMEAHPNLAVFGYTARDMRLEPIGIYLADLVQRFGSRFMIRQSDGARDSMCTVSIRTEAERPADTFICPEQTELRRSQEQGRPFDGQYCCGKCALCWSTNRNVAFLAH